MFLAQKLSRNDNSTLASVVTHFICQGVGAWSQKILKDDSTIVSIVTHFHLSGGGGMEPNKNSVLFCFLPML